MQYPYTLDMGVVAEVEKDLDILERLLGALGKKQGTHRSACLQRKLNGLLSKEMEDMFLSETRKATILEKSTEAFLKAVEHVKAVDHVKNNSEETVEIMHAVFFQETMFPRTSW